MTKEQVEKAMAYLDEKIKKASETWKGVDVDAYMDKVRGREPREAGLNRRILGTDVRIRFGD